MLCCANTRAPCSDSTSLTEPGLLVLDGNVATSRGLVCAANVVGDLLILGLLKGGL